MTDGPKVRLDVIDIIGRKEYSGKIVWLREYIQNAVDAGSSDYIKISLHGRVLEIMDRGKGMDADELNRQAFSVTGSQKTPEEIGELGIGMYAGTGICDNLVILTKKAYGKIFKAVLNMVKYRELVRSNRDITFEDGIGKILSIGETDLPNNTYGDSFTIIRLENLNNETLEELKKDKLLDFIAETVDLPLSDKLPRKDEIEKFLNGYKRSIKVIVDYEGEIIEPKKFDYDGLDNIKELYTEDVISDNNRIIGKVWAIYSSTSKEIPNASIFVKRKGLTVVRDGNQVSSLFDAKYAHRYIGEILVLDENIEINTGRDWFIASKNLDEFIDKVRIILNNLWGIADFDSKLGIGVLNLVKKRNELLEKENKSKENNDEGSYLETQQKRREIEKKIQTKIIKAEQYKENVENGKIDISNQTNKIKLELLDESLNNPRVKDFEDSINIEQQPIQNKARKSPWPKQVLTFLKLNIMDKELAKDIGDGDIKDVSDRSFTFIEQKIKKKLGIKELEHKEWKELITEFKKKYTPPDLKGSSESEYRASFDRIMCGVHTILRNPSNHSFMKDMNTSRSIIQTMLIADFIVQWIDQWQPKLV